MLPVSLDCLFSLPLQHYLTFICAVSCVPYVASFSWFSFWLPLRYSLIFICPLSYEPYAASLSGLSFFISPSVLSSIFFILCQMDPMLPVYLDFHVSFPLGHFLTLICLLSCVFYAASFSGFSFFITPSVLSSIFFVLRLVYLMLQVSLDCPFSLPFWYSLTCICPASYVSYVASLSGLSFFITPSVFSKIYLCFVLCTQCCQFLWIVLYHYPFGVL